MNIKSAGLIQNKIDGGDFIHPTTAANIAEPEAIGDRPWWADQRKELRSEFGFVLDRRFEYKNKGRFLPDKDLPVPEIYIDADGCPVKDEITGSPESTS